MAPVIVAADADLDYALPLLVKGGFYHAGQVCVSVQRVFADRKIARPAGRAAGRRPPSLEGGRPDAARNAGRPADPRSRKCERVGEWVEEAVQRGAKAACGGRAISAMLRPHRAPRSAGRTRA